MNFIEVLAIVVITTVIVAPFSFFLTGLMFSSGERNHDEEVYNCGFKCGYDQGYKDGKDNKSR